MIAVFLYWIQDATVMLSVTGPVVLIAVLTISPTVRVCQVVLVLVLYLPGWRDFIDLPLHSPALMVEVMYQSLCVSTKAKYSETGRQ